MKSKKTATDKTPPKTIDEYIAGYPQAVRRRLETIRLTIRKAAPEAQEKISYRMPAFMQHGMLVYFAAFTNHIGLYPRGSKFKRELSAYAGGKGTVQFPHDKPIPFDLISKIVKFRVSENVKKLEARTKKRRANAKSSKTNWRKSTAKKAAAKEHLHYHKDGTLWAKGQMVGDVMTGYWEWFRKDGTKLRSGHFENGEQIAEWITYDKQGKVYKVTNIKAKKPKAKKGA